MNTILICSRSCRMCSPGWRLGTPNPPLTVRTGLFQSQSVVPAEVVDALVTSRNTVGRCVRDDLDSGEIRSIGSQRMAAIPSETKSHTRSRHDQRPNTSYSAWSQRGQRQLTRWANSAFASSHIPREAREVASCPTRAPSAEPLVNQNPCANPPAVRLTTTTGNLHLWQIPNPNHQRSQSPIATTAHTLNLTVGAGLKPAPSTLPEETIIESRSPPGPQSSLPGLRPRQTSPLATAPARQRPWPAPQVMP